MVVMFRTTRKTICFRKEHH